MNLNYISTTYRINRKNIIFQVILVLLLFSPLFSIITLISNQLSINYYFKIIFIFFGIYFVLIHRIKLNLYHLFILLFATYLFIWSFYNGIFEKKGFISLYNLTVLSIFFFTITLANISFSEKLINFIIVILKITIILSFIASLIQVYNPSFLDANYLWDPINGGDTRIGDLYRDRRTSIFGFIDTNSYGLDYIPILFITLSIMLLNKSKYVFIYIAMGGLTALLTNSRYIMVAFFIGLIMIPIYRKIKSLNSLKYLIGGFILFLIIYQSLDLLGYSMKDWFENRVFEESSIKETTRYKAIDNFLIMFPKNPIFGIGTETNDELLRLSHEVGSSRIHVGYLGYAVAWGIVGGFLLFGSWFLILRMFYIHAKRTRYWGSFFGFLSFIWANATFPQYSIFYYGILLTFVFDKYYYDKYLMSKYRNLKEPIKTETKNF